MTPILLALAIAAAAFAGAALAQLFEPEASLTVRVIAALTAILPAAILAPQGADAAFVAWSMLLAALFVALAAIDLNSRTVPDVLSIPLILLGLTHAWMRGLAVGTMAITVGVIIVAALAVSLMPSRLRFGIGGGDVLLLAGALAWLGPTVALDLVILTAGFMVPIFALSSSGRLPSDGAPAAPAFAAATMILWLHGPVF